MSFDIFFLERRHLLSRKNASSLAGRGRWMAETAVIG
jgi:hypothetical protein